MLQFQEIRGKKVEVFDAKDYPIAASYTQDKANTTDRLHIVIFVDNSLFILTAGSPAIESLITPENRMKQQNKKIEMEFFYPN